MPGSVSFPMNPQSLSVKHGRRLCYRFAEPIDTKIDGVSLSIREDDQCAWTSVAKQRRDSFASASARMVWPELSEANGATPKMAGCSLR
jgi:hypothetical protein